MIQDIITFVIIVSAVAYTAWSLFKTLTVSGSQKCDGCSGCALKNELGLINDRRTK